jgi:glucosylceramidase
VTSAPGAYWQEQTLTPANGGATVTVNDSQVLGEWRAFGGTFNEAGWATMKFLSDADRDRAISLLFDKADGLGFTYGRIPIGSSDYGLDRYSLNETQNDFEMTNFSIDRDRENLIPYIHAALAVQPNIHFWGSPWSPPTWMKSNGQFDRGNMLDDDKVLGAHALYLARFVEEYDKEGIRVDAVHPQNEPGYQQDYPSCGWSAQLMTKYIRDYLGPLFADRLPDREIWVGTMSNTTSKSIVDTVMGDSGAASFVSGIGVQWSQDQYVPGYLSQYQVPVMQTEHRCGNFPNGNNTARAPNDDAYARESWGYIAHYIRQGVSSYMAWNMVLNTAGHNIDTARLWAQNALLVVDEGAQELIVTPTYYVFRHVSQFVDPDSVRVGTQGGDSVAWKNPDGDIVLVMHNSGNSPSNEVVSIGGSTYQVSIPGQGWATVNWQAP